MYVLVVHVIDSLPIVIRDAAGWRWVTDGGFDLFKFFAWFVVPLALAVPTFERSWFTFARWRRIDWVLLWLVIGGGAVLMLLLPQLPGVGEYYRGWARYPANVRLDYLQTALLWTASWLIGWEFVHRYLLPRHLLAAWPRRGPLMCLILLPVIEGGYHLVQQKPLLECLGMAALSLAFTAWVVRKRNALLPALGHLAIEVELIFYLYFN